MLWSEDKMQNPVMTFPIKKRINTELFIERRPALYILNSDPKNKGLSENVGAKEQIYGWE